MALVEVGRVCIKKYGRDAGKKAVITRVVGNGVVNIMTSTRLKDRKCNIKHLEFLSEKIEVGNREQLARALEIEQSKLKQ